MTKTAMSIADEYCEGRLVSLLEGGYNVDGQARAVEAHVGTLVD
jgi:acetoin utilization deacetylase AcuC-like enzyme